MAARTLLPGAVSAEKLRPAGEATAEGGAKIAMAHVDSPDLGA